MELHGRGLTNSPQKNPKLLILSYGKTPTSMAPALQASLRSLRAAQDELTALHCLILLC